MSAIAAISTVSLQVQLQSFFSNGGLLLRKWNLSDAAVLEQIPPELKDTNSTHKCSLHYYIKQNSESFSLFNSI